MEEPKTSVSPQIPPVSSHHEHLLHEVESSDGQLGAILRTLYDSEEQDMFLESLASRVRGHEKDIERMCNKNYQGFIESVSELLKVKSDAHKLKRKIQSANHIIQETGQELMRSAEELHHSRQVQKNIVATVETLSLCIPVLEQYCKLNEQMEQRHYYSALKTLEQLEHTLLPRVRGYIFSDLLNQEIPKLRKSIQDQSKAELTDFLTSVREKSEFIGEVAMHQTQRHSKLELAQDVMEHLDPSNKPDPDVCAQDLIDFSPVYRCLHIHSVLGKRDQFTEDYRNQRRRQVRLAIKPHGAWKGQITDYKRYFYGIVGFFVVEDTMLHTSQNLVSHKGGEDEPGLVTRKIVHEFWQMALSEVLAVLRNNCNYCPNYHLLLKIKQLVVWFCHTIRGYGFEVEKLYEVLLEIRDQYDDLLMKAWGDSFTQIFDSDDYNPIQVCTDDQYHGVLEVFPYQNLHLAHAPFPKNFPFSGMVPQVFRQLKLFVLNCTFYADKLNLSQTEINDRVRKSVNLLLNRVLSSCLSKLINKERLTIFQLVQIWVNIYHIEQACPDLEQYIMIVTKTESEGITAARLYGVSAFKDARQIAEHQIGNRLTMKVTEVMEGADYEWMPKEPMTQPSDYLEDCLRFLDTTISTLSLLPESLVGAVSTKAVRSLATSMENIILSDKYPKVNMEGIKSFNVDLKHCEAFVRSHSLQVPALQDSEGLAAFAMLRKLVDMFLAEQWLTYANTYRSSSEYADVPPKIVYTLLYKLRQSEKKKKKIPIHIKNPIKKKDEKKLCLIKLREYFEEKEAVHRLRSPTV